MGLLDGNLDDPQKQMLMALAAGLLQGSGRTNKNFGADLGNAIPQGLMALNQGRALKSRELDAEQQRQMHAMQLAQMQRQADQQGKIDALAPQFFSSGQPLTPNDDMGNPMPKAPPSFDQRGYAQAVMPINPQLGASMMPRPNIHTLSEGARAVDFDTGRTIADNPKPVGPKEGDIRKFEHRGKSLTYEFTKGEWKKLGETDQFKPDTPDKPPQGYRPDGKGGLTFIPGGPADPNRPGTKTPEHPTEDERRSAGLTVRLSSALKTIEENPDSQKPELLPTAIRAATFGTQEALPNKVTSTSRQKVESAQLDALDAALTLATGAAYTKDQLQNLRKSYFAQLGDSAETVKEKQARFAQIIETARIRAGRASNTIDPVLNKGGASGGWSIKPIQ